MERLRRGLLDRARITGVVIPLPNHLPAEWSIRAAGAGKHVLCKDPLALGAAYRLEPTKQ